MKEVDLPCIIQVGGSRCSDWVELEAQGNSGRILIFWDKRRWICLDNHLGQHSVTIVLEEVNDGFQYVCFHRALWPLR